MKKEILRQSYKRLTNKKKWKATPQFLYLCAILFSIQPNVQAKTTHNTLNLLTIYNLAVKNAPQLKIYQYQENGPLYAKSELEAAKGALLPLVTLNATLVSDNKFNTPSSIPGPIQNPLFNVNNPGLSISLTQPILNLYNWYTYTAAKYGVKAADTNYHYNRQTFINTIATNYFTTLSDEETVKLQEQTVKEQKDLYQVSKAKFEVGLKPITDLKSAESQYIIAKTELLAAKKKVIADKRTLQTYTNVYPNTIAPLKKNLKLSSPEPNTADFWINKAYSTNASLKSQQFTLKNEQTNYSAQWANRFVPTLNLNINDTLQNNTTTNSHTLFNGSFNNSYSIELSLQFNLLNAPLTSVMDASKVSEQNAFYTLLQTKNTIKQETSDNYRNINYLIAEIKAQQQAVASSTLSYKAFLAGYKVGTKTITDVQNTLTQLSQARLLEAKARYQYILAWIQFKQTVGSLSVSDIIKTNRLLQ